jgi:hypothetical protein
MPNLGDLPQAVWQGIKKVVAGAVLRDDSLFVHALEFDPPQYDLATIKFEKFDDLCFVTQNPVAGGFRLRTFWKTDPDISRRESFKKEHERAGQAWRPPSGADEVKGNPRWRFDWVKLAAWFLGSLLTAFWANVPGWIAAPDV